ncbi:hypothetical protein ACFQH1_10785 [Lactiplantibacillus daoliensis]|uniref:Uncharacterized protein n=1 Tax=Lactiplantibacillus daoliensis TaxID=2559916 RepID=A0ABW1UHU7_9LACO|nr:hypothetical protein [Lactiplantibacillus daoliensis]
MGIFNDAMQAMYHSGHYGYSINVKKTAAKVDPKDVPAIVALGTVSRTPSFRTWHIDSPYKTKEFMAKFTTALADCSLEMTDLDVKPEMDGRWGDR